MFPLAGHIIFSLSFVNAKSNKTWLLKIFIFFCSRTRASVEVHIVHSPTSTATAYNVTARVYLTDAMTVTRHVNSELRRNSLSVTQNSSVVYMDVSV